MNKRDLEKDLEIFRNSKGSSSYTICQFERIIAEHAIERAIQAEALVGELKEALNKIAYPVRYLQNEADEKNLSFDGRVAIELANSPHWLKSIAKEVLEK
jgi:hypothetical protein